jgi:hypothetical protein
VTHEFTLIIQGLNLDGDRQGDALFERCDDATFGEVDGLGYGDFHRDTATLADALAGAINDVESVTGLQVMRAEPDALVTAAEIADRLNVSKEYVRLLANGERGGGAFPPPVSHLRSRNRLWRWADIAAWSGRTSDGELHDAYVLATLNALLELRLLRNRIPDEWNQLAALTLDLS